MALSETVWIILAGAVLTYATRFGGHAVLSRFKRLHPKVEAALDAVPAAVLTTIVAPAAIQGGIAEVSALAAAGAISLIGGGMFPVFVGGGAVLVVLRQFFG